MNLIVETKYGKLEGLRSVYGNKLFRGIPYAAPPVGDLRWRKPQSPVAWEGIKRCQQWGAASPQLIAFDPQNPYFKEFYNTTDFPPYMDEDCLFLNVWTPADAKPGDNLPVMVWLHGGGVQTGYSHESEFDGDAICARNCILVTVNYRLNIFGYFAHPELTAENEYGASGMYGAMDQIQALKWLKECIGAFGGDPENIMLMGQSGGGRSTQAICCSPLAKGLLKHAAIHSAGGVAGALGNLTREELEPRGVEFMEMAGCKSIEELRALPWQVLLEKFSIFNAKYGIHKSFNICVDGYVLPKNMAQIIADNEMNEMDYLLCHTSDEVKPFGPGISIALSQKKMAEYLVDQGRNVYMACFDRPMPGDDWGCFHSAELWYLFGTLGRCWRPLTEADYVLSGKLIDYWTNMAKTGDPNGDDLVKWDQYFCRKEMRLSIEKCEMTDVFLNQAE